jgi:hypothetical protein
MGITYVSKQLINDSFTISNLFVDNVTSLNFCDVLRMICTLQVCCPHINGSGSLEFITINDSVIHDITDNTEGINSIWGDFTTEKITGIAVYDTSSELAQLVGTNVNVYKVPGNIFLLNQDAPTIQTVCTNMLNAIKDIQYTPAQLNLILSQPDFNLGDKIVTSNGVCYILNNNMYGSILINQTITSPATDAKLQGEVDSINDTIINAGKYSKLTHDIDSLTSEIYDPNTGILSLIQQNSNQIVLKVDSNGKLVKVELGNDASQGSTLTLNADYISIESSTIQFDNSGYVVTGPVYKSVIKPTSHTIINNGYDRDIMSHYTGDVDEFNSAVRNELHYTNFQVGNDKMMQNNNLQIVNSSYNTYRAGSYEFARYMMVTGYCQYMTSNDYNRFISDGGRIDANNVLVFPSGKNWTMYAYNISHLAYVDWAHTASYQTPIVYISSNNYVKALFSTATNITGNGVPVLIKPKVIYPIT